MVDVHESSTTFLDAPVRADHPLRRGGIVLSGLGVRLRCARLQITGSGWQNVVTVRLQGREDSCDCLYLQSLSDGPVLRREDQTVGDRVQIQECGSGRHLTE